MNKNLNEIHAFNYQNSNLTNLNHQQHQKQHILNKKINSKNVNSDTQNLNGQSLTELFNQFTQVVQSGLNTIEECENQDENLKKKFAQKLNLSYEFGIGDQKNYWEAILYQNNLYLKIPSDCLFETSKEAFVNLLEYAEEELKCQNVIICLDKNLVGKSNNLIRMFMYFGFFTLSPNHSLTPKGASDNLLFMAYSFE